MSTHSNETRVFLEFEPEFGRRVSQGLLYVIGIFECKNCWLDFGRLGKVDEEIVFRHCEIIMVA